MPLPLKKTLGEIRSDIQVILGFGMSGQAGIVNSPIIDAFIKTAQEQLYLQYDFIELKTVYERTTGVEQRFYDYPPDCNAERITEISVKNYGIYEPLKQSIELEHLNAIETGTPMRYELRDQIEVWPAPDSVDYVLRFEYIKTLAPLISNADRTSIPSEIVKLHALANAHTHYGLKGGEQFSAQLEAALTKLKQRQRQTVFGKTNIYPLRVTAEQME